MRSGRRTRWYNRRWDKKWGHVKSALDALRQHVENQGKGGHITLTHLGAYRARQLTDIATVEVKPFTFGYKVEEADGSNGFFKRTLGIRIHGDRFEDMEEREQWSLIKAVCGAMFDTTSPVEIEYADASRLVLVQVFATTFLHASSPDIIVPSKELLLQAFDPARQKPAFVKEDASGLD